MKVWQTWLIAGSLVTGAVIFTVDGDPDKVEIAGEDVAIAVFTQTIEAGPLPTLEPTPDALTFSFIYIESAGSGSIPKDTIVAYKPALDAKVGPGERGTPSAGNSSVLMAFTIKITEAQSNSVAARAWRVTRDGDNIPDGIEAIP